MPELPEVETVARTLRPHVQDRIIADAQVLRATSQHALSMPLGDLRGCRIADVTRRGKLLLLLLDAADAEKASVRGMDDLRLAVHLRMTGRLMAYAAGTAPGAHTRCIFDLKAQPFAAGSGQPVESGDPAEAAGRPAPEACCPSAKSRLFFDDVRAFGTMLAGTPQIFARWPFWRDLGPEPLDMTEAAFAKSIALKKSAIKAVLLDQKMLAGVGNIYADEALFRAGIKPDLPVNKLSPSRLKKLHKQLQAVLNDGLLAGGSSIRDYRDANGESGSFQENFNVYGKRGQPCPVCGEALEHMKLAGRSTVFCKCCQK